MFEVGFSEIVLILGLALLVLGPEKLPGLAEKVGRWTGRARSMARQLRTQLEQEVTLDGLSKSRPMQAPQPQPTPDAAVTPDAEPAVEPQPTPDATNNAYQNFDLDAFSTTESSDVPPATNATTADIDHAASKITPPTPL